ncbi:ABC transporter substrate-binding protein [Okibacterium endophyticum]
MKRKIARLGVCAGLVGVAATLVACSAGGQSEGGSSDVIDVASMEDAPQGTITWCAQKDSSGAFTAIRDAFNERFEGDGYTLELLEFPESTDEWRNQFIQRQEAKSDECDIFGSDVTWTAEFANKGYLYDLTPYVDERADEFIPATLSTTSWQDKNWAVPFGTNIGFLYYRSDLVTEAPATWQDAYAAGREHGGIVYQGSAYEGLTCDFIEISAAAGGEVLSEDGTSSVIDSPENLAALQFMVDGLEDGAAPRDVLTYTEEETRRAFEAGTAALERNWTYAYVLGQQNPEIAGKFEIQPLPAFEGGTGEGASVLGGVNMVISTFSANPGAALKAIDYITSDEAQVLAATKGQAPTLDAAYEDAQVQEALPFWEPLKAGVEQAVARPVTPVYALVSQAIYTNVNKALSGEVTPEQALEQADTDINKALDTF